MSAATYTLKALPQGAAALARALGGKRVGARFIARCPAHDDSNPSLSITEKDGKLLVKCHAGCSQNSVVTYLREHGLWDSSKQENGNGSTNSFYIYNDEQGQPLHRTVRTPDKHFWQEHFDAGAWVKGIGLRRVIYHFDEITDRQAERLFVAEGETDVDRLRSFGYLGTCNPMGAGKWDESYTEAVAGRDIILLYDNDSEEKKFVGQNHAADVALFLIKAGCRVRIIHLPSGKDVSDFLDQGGTREELERLIADATFLTAADVRAWRMKFDTFVAKREASAAIEWPEVLELDSELPPVSRMSTDLIPASFRGVVRDVSDRMQVPLDYPAVVMVLCLAGAVSRRAMIQPKANDTGWVVVPNLWGGIIAPPGFLKSPVIQAATRPLNQIQAEWRREHDEGLTEFARAKEEYELRRAAWKEQYKASSKTGKAAPGRPEDEPKQPQLRRLVVNDATFEALHQTMSENLAGILVIRDELTGWWSQLDRAGREGERAFCLQAWNGDTGHTIDRIGRGTVHVEACCMSMLGGIQPGRLRSYLVDALQDGPSNDGLIQRFQLLVWPDTVSDWTNVDRAPDAMAEEQTTRVLSRLLKLDAERPARLKFASGAQELFTEWQTELEAKVRGIEFHPALISHLSKYRSLMPSLALLFSLADAAAGNGDAHSVSLGHARLAAAWCDYLESHAKRVYSCVVTPQMRAAHELAHHIKRRGIRNRVGGFDWFTARDVYLKGWSGLDNPEAVKQAVEVLQDAGWIRAATGEPGPSGGRPSNRYEVNPGMWR